MNINKNILSGLLFVMTILVTPVNAESFSISSSEYQRLEAEISKYDQDQLRQEREILVKDIQDLEMRLDSVQSPQLKKEAEETLGYRYARLSLINKFLLPAAAIGIINYATSDDDTTPPVMALNGNSSVTVELGDSFNDPGATADSGKYPVTVSGSVNTNVVGVYTLTYSSQDGAGNIASIQRTVTVVDTTAPVVTVTGSDVTHELGGAYTDAGATATDASGTVTVVTSGTVNVNAVGSYVLTYTSTDASGNAGTATRTVTVVDTTAPVVTVTGSDVTHELGGAYTDAGATATDASGTVAVVTSGTVNVNAVGSYVLTYTSTDASGNTGTATRTVTVVDTTAPVVTVTGSDVTHELGGAYTDAGATATDASGTVAVVTSGTVNVNAVGSYVLTYTSTDASGNAGTATRTVTVVDTTAPVVTITGDNPATHELGGAYTDAGATATDASGDVTVVTSGTVNVNAVGSYVLTYTSTDASGNAGTATRTVTVVDTTAPVITITGDNPATHELGGAYTDAGATATDASGDVTVIANGDVNTDKPGSYVITYISNDASGNAGTATRTVTVVDTTAPVVTVTGSDVTHELGGAYTDAGATATDASGDVTVVTSGTVNVDKVGVYTLTYTSTDASGNAGTATRTVTVVDTTAPVVTVTGSDVTHELGGAYTDAGATATDASGDVTVVTSGTVNVDKVGVYTLTYTSTDASGNAGTATRTVTVVDTTAPVVTVTGSDVTHELGGAYTDAGATATDASGDVTVVTSSIDVSSVGLVTVTYTSTDASGNTGTATRTVTVVDTTAPVLTVIGDNPLSHEVVTSYVDLGASVSDASISTSGDTITVVTTGIVNPNVLGSYTKTYTATDASGNSSTATRTINVVDTVGPVITIAGDNPITVQYGANYIDAGATAVDALDGSVSVSLDSTWGTTDAFGTYTMTYSAVDAAGNISTAVRTVELVDTQGPEITIAGDNPVTVQYGANYVDAGATAVDNYDGAVDVTLDSTWGTTDAFGTYTMTYTATDSFGNTSTKVRTVELVDTQGPVITILGANPVTVDYKSNYADPGATAVDNYDGAVDVTLDSTWGTDELGNHVMTYTATDSFGNTSTAVRNVSVEDTSAPVVTLNGDSEVTVEFGSNYIDAGATATDNQDDPVTIILDSTWGTSDALGVYTMTYTSTDAAGNTGTAVRTITLVDTSGPVITINGSNPATVQYQSNYIDAGASANDLRDGNVSVSLVSTWGTDEFGTHEMIYSATDSLGNTSTATRTVTVVDTEGPTITSSSSFTADENQKSIGFVVASDPSGVASYSISGTSDIVIANSGAQAGKLSFIENPDYESQAVYTATVQVTDTLGNSTSQAITVTINDVGGWDDNTATGTGTDSSVGTGTGSGTGSGTGTGTGTGTATSTSS
jgi:hypothetical protein